MHARVNFLAGWVEVGHCVTDDFIFVKEKKSQPQKEQK